MEAATARSAGFASSTSEAERLAADGHFLDAAKVLHSLPPDERDASIDARIVELRHQAFAELRTNDSIDTDVDRLVLPDLPDLFPGVVGPPEVPAADVTPELLASAIRHHGCLLVRGMIAAEDAGRLRDDVDHAFEAYGRFRKGAPSTETGPWYSPLPAEYGRDDLDPLAEVFLYSAGGVYGGSSPRSFLDYLDTLTDAGVIDLVRAQLDEPPILSLNKCVLRRISGGAQNSWHQDALYLGVGIRALNLWMSLSHCGGDTDSMGLDVLPRRLDTLAEQGTHSAIDPRAIAQEVVEDLARDHPVVRPLFAPGDGLLFDHLFVHRSDIRPVTTDRYAIESWFFAPSTYPSNQVPIVAV